MSAPPDWIIGTVMLALIGVGVPVIVWCAALGKIPPNPLIGIRVGPIDSSEYVWQRAHRAALPATVAAGVLAIAFATAAALTHGSPEAPDARTWYLVAGYASLLILGTVAAVIAYLTARRCALETFTENTEEPV